MVITLCKTKTDLKELLMSSIISHFFSFPKNKIDICYSRYTCAIIDFVALCDNNHYIVKGFRIFVTIYIYIYIGQYLNFG